MHFLSRLSAQGGCNGDGGRCRRASWSLKDVDENEGREGDGGWGTRPLHTLKGSARGDDKGGWKSGRAVVRFLAIDGRVSSGSLLLCCGRVKRWRGAVGFGDGQPTRGMSVCGGSGGWSVLRACVWPGVDQQEKSVWICALSHCSLRRCPERKQP
jgi:hypothetical protein